LQAVQRYFEIIFVTRDSTGFECISMRLVQVQADGGFSLVQHEGISVPPYAILSHTWGDDEDELNYDDMRNQSGREKIGYAKLNFCARQAIKDGLRHFWVDTCCIDKSSSAELSEAITSMFRWYKNSAQCYAYLADVTTNKRKVDHETPHLTWVSAFRTSKWFTRGWTLQELLAPRVVLFFSREGGQLGDKLSLEQHIHDVTRIPIPALRGASLHGFSVEDRMSWAETRTTKREEDSAYSLLGIFGVSMVPMYGEEKEAAFRRLRREIKEATKDSGASSGDEKRQALMESLRFDQLDARHATIKNAHAKTCKWLLRKSEHIAWLDTTKLPSHHGFLWIKGKPGTGKSTLMKFAFSKASKSTNHNTVIAFFFNARGEVLEKTIIGMYRSLLLQLLDKNPTLQCTFDSLSLSPSSISAEYQWTINSLEAQLEQVVLSLGETPVICFIDALDECEQWQVRSMISFFEHLGELAVSSGRSFRVCFSSRHYPEVTIRRGISLVLEGQEGHIQDIDNYLESALNIGTSAVAQQIRGNLLEKASGVFMWVVLVVDILNKEYDGGRIHALKRRLCDIPANLHDLFRDILTRDSHNTDELILCIQWVLFAKQPLRPEQLYFAILAGTEPDAIVSQDHQEVTADTMRRFLLGSSKGLTEITQSKNIKVQFIHESVRDFLLKDNGLGKIWPEFGSNFQGQSHDRLKQCCLSYISIDVAAPLKIPDDLPKASSEPAASLRKSATQAYPFLEYAIQNVLYHANAAEGGGISQAGFLNSFPLPRCVKLDNLFEKYEVRRHTERVSLLYLLAELNAANLIRVHPSVSSCLDMENERYGCAFFAANAIGNQEAMQACIEGLKAGQSVASHDRRGPGGYSSEERVEGSLGRNFKYSDKVGILIYAAEIGSVTVFSYFIGLGNLDLDSKDTKGRTPLYIAAERGASVLTRMLLDKGADVNAQGGEHGNILYAALAKGNKEIVKLLLDKGADVNAQGGVYGNVLVAASFGGYKEIVKLLLDKGADVNAQGGLYGNALVVASFGGYKEIVKLLLDKGADVNAQDGVYGNALVAASLGGYKEIVTLLLDKGAEDNAQGEVYGNALLAASANRHGEVVALLRKRSASGASK
jgi:ankyrin repeat protein